MAGEQQHVIGDLRFELQFPSTRTAFAQQSGITDFIKNELLPVADRIFHELNTNGQTIRFDKLELDLGKVSYDSMRPDIARQFGHQLRKALTDVLGAKRPDESPRDGIPTKRPDRASTESLTPERSLDYPTAQRMSLAQSELQIVQHFLSSGHLPWQATLHGASQFDALLIRVLGTSAADLIGYLRAGSTTVLDRLIGQLPERGLTILLDAIAPGYRESLAELVRAVDALLRSATTLPGARPRVWTATIRRLLGSRVAKINGGLVLAAAQAALVDAGIDRQVARMLPHELTSATEAKAGRRASRHDASEPDHDGGANSENSMGSDVETLTTLIGSDRIDELTRDWAEFIGPRRSVFAKALRLALRRGGARRRLAAALSDDRLAEIVTLLKPKATDFIVRFVGNSQAFSLRAATQQAERGSVRAHLWEYSIAYLVIEPRGRRFNALSYIECVLRQLAAHGTLDYTALLASVASQLPQADMPGVLRTELDDLVNTLMERERDVDSDRHESSARSGPQHDAETPPKLEMSDASGNQEVETHDVGSLAALIRHGDTNEVTKRWSELVGPRRSLFAKALRQALRRGGVRRRLVAALSDDRLAEFVTLLAPEATDFIVGVVGQPQVFSVGAAQALADRSSVRARLWEYSLAYLVVEPHGRRFHALSYIKSVLRQLAAHGTLDYTALVASVTLQLPQADMPGTLRTELHDLVSALMDRERDADAPGRPASRQDERLTSALETIDVLRDFAAGMATALDRRQCQDLLEQLVARQPWYLRRLLRELRVGRDTGSDAGDSDITINTLVSELLAARDRSVACDTASADTPVAVRASGDPTIAAPAHEALAADAPVPTEQSRADFSPENLSAVEPPGEALPAAESAQSDAAFLLALGVLRQMLWRWPEHIRAVVCNDELARRASASSLESLRSAVDAFLTRLGAASGTPSSDAAAHLQQLAAASGKTERFWRRELIAFSRRYDDLHYPLEPEFAALHVQSLLVPAREARPMSHYGAVVQRFDELIRAIETRPDPTALNDLRALFDSERDALYLVNSVAERSLAIALAQLLPREYPAIRYLTEVITAAASFPHSYLTACALRRLVWRELFDWLIGQGQPFAQATLARHLASRLLDVMRIEDAEEFVGHLRARLPRAARQQDWLSDLIPYLGPDPVRSFSDSEEPESPSPGDNTDSDEEIGLKDPIFIQNAGMVLLAPYLPRLFTMLKLTDDDGFVDHSAAERAAQLLQFVVTGSGDAPEYELVLNKLLCGIPPGRPLAREFDVSNSESETVQSLLDAVIEHWGALGNTSRESLRSTFLQREGRLHRADNGWHLTVENRAFDMLLDHLPWSFRLIKYPWMDEVLHVDWR